MISLRGGHPTFLHPSRPGQCRSPRPAPSCWLPPTSSSPRRRPASSYLPGRRFLAKPAWNGHRRIVCCAASGHQPAKALRDILETPGIHQGPACFDALSAKLVERAGFQFCFTSGFSVSAARLCLPDVGLISYGEMVDQGYQITQAVSIPVIGDGDNGYGNQMNVKRTVKGFIRAGFAGIILEDQVAPKACGHTQGRKVVSREESVMRIKAAIDAREESGSDIVIVARTDSRQAVSLDESLWRSRAFADAGADVLFIDALASREEMKAFCDISPLLPKMANMLEGGGKTPILNPIELEEIGFKIVSYPLSLIGVSIRAMQDALTAIKSGRVPPPGSLPSFEEIKEIIGFNDYYEEEKRYSTSVSRRGYSSASSDIHAAQSTARDDTEPITGRSQYPVVEVLQSNSSYDSRGRFSGIWSRTLRIRVTGRDGIEKAGFLDGVTKIIPGLVGVNIMDMLEDAAVDVDDNFQKGKVLLDLNDALGDRIQVLVE
uniref:2,3-dimethylmalate lyase n=1 Tax=Anthurium amnicola TaxID=1678845 RepID=A0A1D1XWF0_9ARAE